jgi:glucose-1-phosphate adenylyltransferase
MIYGKVRNSVLFPGVFVGKEALIENSIVMSNSHIEECSVLDHCIIGEGVTVGRNVRIGFGENIPNEDKPSIYNSGITVVGERAEIPDDFVVGKNVMIDMNVGSEDFCSNTVPSGASVYKGGECEW